MKKTIILWLTLWFLAGSYLPVNYALAEEPVKCRGYFNNEGYLFDNFEQVDYMGGFLSMHFRLKEPYNDGRGWRDKFFLHKADCSASSYTTVSSWVDPVTPKMKLFSIRFSSTTHYDVWNDETDTKLQCEGCFGDLPEGQYTAISYSGERDGSATFFHSGSYPIVSGQVAKVPILIIPGILGTELSFSDQKIWLDPKRLVNPFNDSLKGLEMNGSGDSMRSIVVGPVLKDVDYSFGKFHYSDLLFNALVADGYVADQNLFEFAYDWRMDIDQISKLLRVKIDEVLVKAGATKINVIAHSMGGLVVKQYILNNGTASFGRIVFVGVPNLGSADAVKMLIFGDSLSIPLLRSQDVQAIAQNMPSIYQLLPTKEYFNRIQGYYDDLSDINNKQILNYDQSKTLLLGLNKNSVLINRAEQLHGEALDNLDLNNVEAYNIVGCGLFTLKTITKVYSGTPSFLKKYYAPKYRLTGDSGDGTVLQKSAEYLKIPENNKFYSVGVEHSKMLSSDGTREFIAYLAEGKQPVISGAISNNSTGCAIKGRLVSLPNNLEIQILNSKTGNPLVANYDYQVRETGNDATIYLSPKIATEAIIVAKPTLNENIKASFDVKNYDQGKNYHYENVDVSQKITVNFNDNSEKIYATTPAGEELIPPTNTVENSEQTNAPSLPPLTKLYWKGQLINDKGTLSLKIDDREVTLTAESNNSFGVSKSYYSFDGETWKEYLAGNILIPLDAGMVDYFSVDKIGNVEEVKEIQIKWVSQGTTETYVPQPASSPVVVNKDEPEVLEVESEPDLIKEDIDLPVSELPDQTLVVPVEKTGLTTLNINLNITGLPVSPAKVIESTDSRKDILARITGLIRILYHLIFI